MTEPECVWIRSEYSPSLSSAQNALKTNCRHPADPVAKALYQELYSQWYIVCVEMDRNGRKDVVDN